MINKNHFEQIKAVTHQNGQDEVIEVVHRGSNDQISSNFHHGQEGAKCNKFFWKSEMNIRRELG